MLSSVISVLSQLCHMSHLCLFGSPARPSCQKCAIPSSPWTCKPHWINGIAVTSRDKPWQAQNIAKIIYRICVIMSYYFSVQDELTPTVRDCDILHKARPPRLAFLHQFLHLVELPHQGGVEASRISQQMRWSVTEWLHHDNILWETLLQMFMFNHRNVQ